MIVDASLNTIPHDYVSDEYADRVIYPVLRDLQLDIKIAWCNEIYHRPLDIELINASDVDVVVIPACDHPFNQSIIDFNRLTKKYIFLSQDATSTFYPFWSIYYPKFVDIAIPSIEDAMNAHRRYKFSCLNGHPSWDRVVNLLHMRSRQMYDDAVLTFNIVDTGGPQAAPDIMGFRNAVIHSCPDLINVFDSIELPIHHPAIAPMPRAVENNLLFNVPLEVSNAAYLDSYINIITETSDNFISEKSMKPMLAGQLFVTTSNQKTLDLLREIGFDVFDDIFDNHSYSEHGDIPTRINDMHILLESLNVRDMESLYVSTVDRRLHNRNLLLSNKIADKYNGTLINMLTSAMQ